MSMKLTTKEGVKFTRGSKKEGTLEYSSGGEEGETVEVPQIDEELGDTDFYQALVNLIGNADTTKQIVNRRVLQEQAIKEGQNKFKASYKKGKTTPIEEATKEAILAVRDYIPILNKERGQFIAEAKKAMDQMDSLQEAYKKMQSGEMEDSDFASMLETAFAVDE